MPSIAVVTGSNKGIGFAIVKSLSKQLDGGVVYLTARNVDLGEKALAIAKTEVGGEAKADLKFHQLDITDQSSINSLRDYLKTSHGGIDILINNAGIAYKQASTAPFSEQAEVSMKTNYEGTKNVCRALFPLLKPHARVVNVSSQGGLLTQLKSEELKRKFIADDLTVDQLDALAEDFVNLTKSSAHASKGYSNSAYGMSKIAMTALTRVLQRELDVSRKGQDVVVTACCPGYVDTDMSSHKGSLTPDEGGDTPVFLALLPQNWDSGRGRFFFLRKEKDWFGGTPGFSR